MVPGMIITRKQIVNRTLGGREQADADAVDICAIRHLLHHPVGSHMGKVSFNLTVPVIHENFNAQDKSPAQFKIFLIPRLQLD